MSNIKMTERRTPKEYSPLVEKEEAIVESTKVLPPGDSLRGAYDEAVAAMDEAMKIIIPQNDKVARNNKEVAVDGAKKKFNLVLKAIKNKGDIPFLRKALVWQRSRRFIDRADDAWLSEKESSETQERCQVISKTPASFHATLHEVYNYTRYFDEKTLSYMYITYIKRTIPPEEQLGVKAAWKINQNMPLAAEDYPEPKDQYIRIPLSEKQWLKFFKPV